MNLIPLLKEQLVVLLPVFDERRIEANLQERSDILRMQEYLEAGYDARYMGAYVDDVLNPKVVLIMSHYPDIFSFDIVCSVSLIYIHPDLRGDVGTFNELITVAKNYGRLNRAKRMTCSSWEYRGSKPIAALLKLQGFEKQETVYTTDL